MNRYILKVGLVVISLLMAAPVFALGVAHQLRGDVSVINQDGVVRPLVLGARVESRETIVTDEQSEALIKTDDNGLLLLKSNSKLYIASYHVGNGKNHFSARLLKGSIYGETGRIGKSNLKQYRLYTANALVKLQGSHYTIELKNDSTRVDTYVKVDSGKANLSSRNISLNVEDKQLAVAASNAPPQLLEITPNNLFALPMLKPQVQQLNEKNTKSIAAKLQSGNRVEATDRVPLNCTENSPAQRVLDDFIHAYERGDTGYIQRRLDPSMIGYGALLNSMMKDVNKQKQIRFLIQNRNGQCGPDLAVINFRWEKRFLDLVSFRPRLETGQAAVLTHLKSGEWKLSGISGDSPFASGLRQQPGVTRLTIAPSAINAGAVGTGPPVSIAAQIKLADQSLAGKGTVQITATSNVAGFADSVSITLAETVAGVFVANAFSVVQAATLADAAINVSGGATTLITLTFTHPNTGVVVKRFVQVAVL